MGEVVRLKVYEGRVNKEGFFDRVLVNGTPLDPRLDLQNHSPDGLSWGYGGSGPTQLSLAILADALGDDLRAMRLYQSFKWGVIAKLPQRENFRLTHAQVMELVAKIESL